MGASALLLYPDPEHYNPPKLNLNPFPESPYMPSDAVRHDSILWNGAGDPQTPGFVNFTIHSSIYHLLYESFFLIKNSIFIHFVDIQRRHTLIVCPYNQYDCRGMSYFNGLLTIY